MARDRGDKTGIAPCWLLPEQPTRSDACSGACPAACPEACLEAGPSAFYCEVPDTWILDPLRVLRTVVAENFRVGLRRHVLRHLRAH